MLIYFSYRNPLPNGLVCVDPLPDVLLILQAGFWETMLMLFIGYLVVVLTVLSISAIATSATVGGGGVYCILSQGFIASKRVWSWGLHGNQCHSWGWWSVLYPQSGFHS